MHSLGAGDAGGAKPFSRRACSTADSTQPIATGRWHTNLADGIEQSLEPVQGLVVVHAVGHMATAAAAARATWARLAFADRARIAEQIKLGVCG